MVEEVRSRMPCGQKKKKKKREKERKAIKKFECAFRSWENQESSRE